MESDNIPVRKADDDEWEFRLFLYKLSEDLSANNLKGILFVTDLPASTKEQITNPTQLMKVLHEESLISHTPGGLGFLSDILKSIHRADLSEKTCQFMQKMSRYDVAAEKEKRIEILKNPRNSQKLIPPSGFSSSKGAAGCSPSEGSINFCSEDHSNLSDDLVYAVPGSTKVELPYTISVKHDQTYQMNSVPRGYCLIINNEDFSATRTDDSKKVALDDRQGTAVDALKLKETFRKFKFEVKVEDNRSAKEMYSIFEDFAEIGHADCDCFVACILSHGCKEGVYGVDGGVLYLGSVISLFEKCPTLKDKPKLFIVQCCRGNDEDSISKTYATSSINFEELPGSTDFYLAFATPSGYVSWRSLDNGTWFISLLCEQLNLHPHLGIDDIMKKVTNQLSAAYTNEGGKQVSQVVDTLSKNLVFGLDSN